MNCRGYVLPVGGLTARFTSVPVGAEAGGVCGRAGAAPVVTPEKRQHEIVAQRRNHRSNLTVSIRILAAQVGRHRAESGLRGGHWNFGL